MKHTIYFSAALLFGLLLVPAETWGKVHASVSPDWIQSTCFSVRNNTAMYDTPYDIDVTQKEEIYVVGNRCLEKFDSFGYGAGSLNEESIFYSHLNFEGYLDKKYVISAGNKYIYINEGFDSYDLYFITDNSIEAYGGHVTYGGFGIAAYASLSESESPWLIVPGSTFEAPMNFGVRGDILGLDTDVKDNIYVTGIYNNSLPDPLPSPPGGLYSDYIPVGAINVGGDIDVFLASYTTEGALRWSRRIDLPDYEYPEDWHARQFSFYFSNIRRPFILSGNNGNTYLFGRFGNDTVFGEGQANEVTLPVDSNYSDTRPTVLVSYDTEGNLRWVRTPDHFGVLGEDVWLVNLTVDNEDNLFIVWEYDKLDPAILDTAPFAGIDDSIGAILAKHAPDGTVLWAHALERFHEYHPLLTHSVTYDDMVTDARGHVYIGGSFDSDSTQIGDVVLYNHKIPLGRTEGFIAHFDNSGKLLWVGHATGAGSQSVKNLAVSPAGDLYVAGGSERPFQLGSETHRAGGFLAKYAASTITSSEPVPEIPTAATLASNYPNPFTHATTIEYALLASGPVRLVVYDALGREVATLADGVQHAGRHTAVFDGTSLPSGVYLYRLETAGQASTGLMTLRK